ncbi:MAG: PadR family transcriptional regulator [Treponema sp.]|jgi:DNA-binding PadR family transcriptional regulator|nr:PadR family transcriptional regulator [Treponema sp.]
MSLKYGLLGLLNYGEMTGYELDKAFKDSLEFFWQGQTSQVYRELNAMENAGWLSSKIEVQTGKPNRKIYAITKQGRDEFMKWLRPGTESQNGTAAPDESILEALHLRSSFLMKLFFSGELRAEETAAFIMSFRDECRAVLRKMKTTPDNIGIYKKKLKHPEAAAGWQMVALFGRKYYRSCEKWADEMLKTLLEREDL